MAKGRAVTFIANPEVIEFLDSLESGLKSKVINRALAQYMENVDPDDVLAVGNDSTPYKSSLLGLIDFAEWLEEREERKERTYSLSTNEGTTVRLAYLLKKFEKERKKARADLLLDRHAELYEQEEEE